LSDREELLDLLVHGIGIGLGRRSNEATASCASLALNLGNGPGAGAPGSRPPAPPRQLGPQTGLRWAALGPALPWAPRRNARHPHGLGGVPVVPSAEASGRNAWPARPQGQLRGVFRVEIFESRDVSEAERCRLLFYGHSKPLRRILQVLPLHGLDSQFLLNSSCSFSFSASSLSYLRQQCDVSAHLCPESLPGNKRLPLLAIRCLRGRNALKELALCTHDSRALNSFSLSFSRSFLKSSA